VYLFENLQKMKSELTKKYVDKLLTAIPGCVADGISSSSAHL